MFLRQQVIEYLNYLLKKKCCVCESDKSNLNKIKYKDKNDKIFAGYKELKHYFCKECTEKIKDKDIFNCKICEEEHTFRAKK